jgi:hypothetical protein
MYSSGPKPQEGSEYDGNEGLNVGNSEEAESEGESGKQDGASGDEDKEAEGGDEDEEADEEDVESEGEEGNEDQTDSLEDDDNGLRSSDIDFIDDSGVPGGKSQLPNDKRILLIA